MISNSLITPYGGIWRKWTHSITEGNTNMAASIKTFQFHPWFPYLRLVLDCPAIIYWNKPSTMHYYLLIHDKVVSQAQLLRLLTCSSKLTKIFYERNTYLDINIISMRQINFNTRKNTTQLRSEHIANKKNTITHVRKHTCTQWKTRKWRACRIKVTTPKTVKQIHNMRMCMCVSEYACVCVWKRERGRESIKTNTETRPPLDKE